MKKLVFYVLVFLAACGGGAEPAQATVRYVSSCTAPYADAACVAGSDANPGTVSTSPKLTAAGCIAVQAAGDSCLFAKGSSEHFTGNRTLFCGSCTPSTPIIFGSYTPAWGPGTARPVWNFVNTNTGITTADAGNSDADGYVTLQGLDIRGPGYAASGQGSGHGTGSGGIYVYNDSDYITIDDCSINGFYIGVYVADASATQNPGSNKLNEYVTIKNSTIQNNNSQGILGAGPWLLIENNALSDNGFLNTCGVGCHSLYIGSAGAAHDDNIIVRGNTITRTAQQSGGGGACTSVVFVAHVYSHDMIVENNTITELASQSGCYLMSIDVESGDADPQDATRLIVRGNKVIVAGTASGRGISCSACPYVIIENNIIIQLGGGSAAFDGIMIGDPAPLTGRGDPLDTSAVVRNNSIYMTTSSASAYGVRLFGSAEVDETITSNVIFFGAGTSATATCFQHSARAIGTFTAFDYNTCYRAAGVATWSTQHSTLATAQAAGFNTNGSTADPGLTVPAASDYLLQASSGAAAVIDAASPTYKSRFGYRGKLPNGARDRGACEYRTGDACSAAEVSVPSSATGLR